MQSTGQTSTQASQPVQPSAWITARILGTTFRGLPAIVPAMNACPNGLSRGPAGCLATGPGPRTIRAGTLIGCRGQSGPTDNDYRFPAVRGQGGRGQFPEGVGESTRRPTPYGNGPACESGV